MYRRWKESKGKDKEYENIIRFGVFVFKVCFKICFFFRKQVTASKLEAEKDNVVVPTTLEEYCIKHKHRSDDVETDLADFYDDDYCDDDYDNYEDNFDEEDDDDSGNGES